MSLSYRHGPASNSRLAAEQLGDNSALPLLAGLAFIGGLIHIGAAVDHANEVPAYTPAFLVVALAQFAWALLIWRGPTRRTLLAGSTLSLGVLFVWVASRTVGLPFGPHPWEPEQFGLADIVESADELVAALVAIVLIGSGGSGLARRVLAAAQPAMLTLLFLSMLYGVGAHAS